jgi:topoisomerase-4 subunit A
VNDKTFVGKDVIHIGVFRKADERTIYNMVYRDGKQPRYMVKRFPVVGITRDREYNVTKGTPDSRVIYFSSNPNGEAEVIRVILRPNPKLKRTSLEYDFSELAIKGRTSIGNILVKKPVKSIIKKEEGVSTLGAREIWFDDTVKRLNVAERGVLLGEFLSDDRILVITSTGHYRHYGYDLSTHFDEDMILIEKYDPQKIMTAVYYDAAQDFVYLKRFRFEISENKTRFIGGHPDSRLLAYSLDYLPVLELMFDEKENGWPIEKQILRTADFISVKSHKAKGKRLSNLVIKKAAFLEPLPFEPETDESEKPGTAEEELPAGAEDDDGRAEKEVKEKKETKKEKEKEKDKEKEKEKEKEKDKDKDKDKDKKEDKPAESKSHDPKPPDDRQIKLDL